MTLSTSAAGARDLEVAAAGAHSDTGVGVVDRRRQAGRQALLGRWAEINVASAAKPTTGLESVRRGP
jgi:hypothetical protein